MRKVILVGQTRRGEFNPIEGAPKFNSVEEAENWLLANNRYNGVLSDLYFEVKTFFTNARE